MGGFLFCCYAGYLNTDQQQKSLKMSIITKTALYQISPEIRDASITPMRADMGGNPGFYIILSGFGITAENKLVTFDAAKTPLNWINADDSAIRNISLNTFLLPYIDNPIEAVGTSLHVASADYFSVKELFGTETADYQQIILNVIKFEESGV